MNDSSKPAIPAKLTQVFSRNALFLDIDGTLLDIAHSPDAVQVPAELGGILQSLSQKLGGALVLVTGRQIDVVDELFSGYRFAVAGLHGAEQRSQLGVIDRVEPDAHFIAAKAYLREMSGKLPGVLLEDKHAAVALHFRNAAAMRGQVERCIAVAAGIAGDRWVVQQAKMAMELRPAGTDKGSALRQFMRGPDFRGRTPLAFGDDLTDEAMFCVATALGGVAVRIGESLDQSCADVLLPEPSVLRNWLEKLAMLP